MTNWWTIREQRFPIPRNIVNECRWRRSSTHQFALWGSNAGQLSIPTMEGAVSEPHKISWRMWRMCAWTRNEWAAIPLRTGDQNYGVCRMEDVCAWWCFCFAIHAHSCWVGFGLVWWTAVERVVRIVGRSGGQLDSSIDSENTVAKWRVSKK